MTTFFNKYPPIPSRNIIYNLSIDNCEFSIPKHNYSKNLNSNFCDIDYFECKLHIFGTKSVNLCFLRFLTLKALLYAAMYKCNQRGFCNWCIERFTKCKWFCPFNGFKNFRGRVVVRFSALAWNERQPGFFSQTKSEG